MPCETKRDGDGRVTMIVCSRGRSSRRCVHCGRAAGLLCDFPVLKGVVRGTCDASLCGRCTTKAGGGDLCRPHANQWGDVTGKPKIGSGAA